MAQITIYRHNKNKKRFKRKSKIDFLVYFAAAIGPLLTLPQVYTIWVQHQKGVSIITWAAYLVASVIWLFYGVKHRDRPIIIVELAWIVLALLIIAGLMRLN